MCRQLVCNLCGQDLQEDRSLIVCAAFELRQRQNGWNLAGDPMSCPGYVRMGRYSWSHNCSVAAAGTLPAPMDPAYEQALFFPFAMPEYRSPLYMAIR